MDGVRVAQTRVDELVSSSTAETWHCGRDDDARKRDASTNAWRRVYTYDTIQFNDESRPTHPRARVRASGISPARRSSPREASAYPPARRHRSTRPSSARAPAAPRARPMAPPPPLAPRDAHPTWFLALLVLLNVVDAFHLNVVWPILPFLVREAPGVLERDIGFFVGVVGAASPLGALCTSYAWGVAADARGRRSALLAGSCLSTLSVFVFGTSKTVRQAFLGRFLSGCLNSNAQIVKTYLGEVCTKKAQAEAFGVLALGYGLASALAPVAGGWLAKPAERWPVFRNTAFETFPYLLPMCVAASLTGLGAVLGYFLLPETASFTKRAEAKARSKSAEEEKRLVKLASAGELREIELGRWDDDETSTGTAEEKGASQPYVLFTPDTTRAVSCYAVLAAIAIGYDEMLPVFLKTNKELGGCAFSTREIGSLLIAGGITLLFFQIVIWKRICAALGAVRAFRLGVTIFSGVCMLAPFASVMPTETLLWTVALASQCTKICALGIGFVSITIVVNNSCADAVKARVNGLAGMLAAFARIVAPVTCGSIFASAMRLGERFPSQFIPFAFVSLVTVCLRIAAERLPTSLDSPQSPPPPVETDEELVQVVDVAAPAPSVN